MPLPRLRSRPDHHLRLHLRNMDIQPHRRLVVPFEPPHFCDLISVSEFASAYFERFGVAKFSADLFSYTTVPVLRRMCDSLGVKLMIDCLGSERDVVDEVLASEAHYAIIPPSCASSPGTAVRRLVMTSGPQDAILASLHPVSGIACDVSFVAEAKSGLHGDPVILSISGDALSAFKAGATMAVIGPDVFLNKDPLKALRSLASAIREYT